MQEDNSKKPVNRERRGLLVALILICFLSCLPLLTNYVVGGKDTTYYLRILSEGGADNLLLLPFEGLVRLGLSADAVYKFLILCINLVTTLLSYAGFLGIFREKKVAVIGCALYTWAPYRLNDLYCRADLGEALAMSFLPLLGYLLYELLWIEGENRSTLWISMALVYSLIFQSYLLSFLVAVGMTILICVVRLRRVFSRRTGLVLVKTAVLFLALNAWSILLLWNRYRSAQFPLVVVGDGRIQSKGIYLLNYLQFAFEYGLETNVESAGMQGQQPLGVGFAVTFGVLVFLWLAFTGHHSGRKDTLLLAFGTKMTILGFVLALLSLNSFPWNAFEKIALLRRLCVLLDAPNRLMPVVLLCFTICACLVCMQISSQENKLIGQGFLVVVAVFALLGVNALTNNILLGAPYRIPYAEMDAELQNVQCLVANLDLSPLDYAKYEGSKYTAPAALVVMEGLSAVAGVGLFVWSLYNGRRKKGTIDAPISPYD